MANPQIIQPGRVGIRAEYLPGPLASPLQVTHQGSQSITTIAVGGATRLEQLAGQIASGWAHASDTMDSEAIARSAVDIAEAIIREVNRRLSGGSESDGPTREAAAGASGEDDTTTEASGPVNP